MPIPGTDQHFNDTESREEGGFPVGGATAYNGFVCRVSRGREHLNHGGFLRCSPWVSSAHRAAGNPCFCAHGVFWSWHILASRRSGRVSTRSRASRGCYRNHSSFL